VYQATLDGLPALFLPPLVELPSMPGLSVYAAEPSVTDVDGQAQRTEKITFVYSHGGDYPIPGAQLRWWNLRSGAIETTTAAPLTVFVTGTQHAATGRPDAPLWWRWWWLLPTLLAGVLVARPMLAGFARWRRAQRQRRLASEAHAFSQLTATLRAGDARQAYQQLLTWQAKLAASADLRQFALDWGDEALAAGLTALADTLYAANAQPIPLSSLEVPLLAARARALKGGANRQAPALPVLNP
jgi:hypothetical protein